jgi:hypothetical protein
VQRRELVRLEASSAAFQQELVGRLAALAPLFLIRELDRDESLLIHSNWKIH